MKISVIIPVYNCEEYIEKCLESIIMQNFESYEIIAINDGSTDKSLEILNEYSRKYNFITVLDRKNSGQGAARNYALKFSKGKYIMFVDSDDYLSGKKSFSFLYNQMEKNKLDLLIYNYNLISDNKVISSGLQFESDNICTQVEIIKKFLNTNEIEGFACNKLFRKDIILANNISFLENQKFEDIPMVVKYLINSKKIMFNNEKIYNYVIRNGSTTRKINLKILLDEVNSMDIVLNTVEKSCEEDFSKDIDNYLNKKISLYMKYRIKNLIRKKLNYSDFKKIIKSYLNLIYKFDCKKKSSIIKVMDFIYGGNFEKNN
ncbi:glycosyltransferase [Clostridium perfringens]|nr:glycosyltransferase [Clostridium perfringens]